MQAPICTPPGVSKTLLERGESYGDYEGGTKFRLEVMKLVQDRYKEVNGVSLSSSSCSIMSIAIFDIVNKLSRIAVTPTHIDSWHDIQGYAKLIEEMLLEDNNDADK